MATTTTYYGFDIPQSTDLVKDGATAIATLGQDIDTAMNTALGTKKSGLVLLNTTSFSAVSSQSVSTIFTSTYQNYRVVITLSSISAALTLRMRMRSGSTDASGADYNGSFIRLPSGSTTVVGDYYGGNTSFDLTNALLSTTGERNSLSFDLYNPQIARMTSMTSLDSEQLNSGGHNIVARAAFHGVASAYDGFTLIASTGNMTGEVSTYGYNK